MPLGLAVKDAGFEVAVAADDFGDGTWQWLLKNEFRLLAVPFLGNKRSLFRPVRCLVGTWRAISTVRPSVVHAITIQSVLIAGCICRLRRIPFVALVAGRGSIFEMTGFKGKLLRAIVKFGYAFSMKNARSAAVFMNPADQQAFVAGGLVPEAKTKLIRGSGVDTERFGFKPIDLTKPVSVLMASRLYREKGVSEFLAAAKSLRREFPSVRFYLAGDIDPMNPTSYSIDQITREAKAAGVEWLGYSQDMPKLLADHEIYCLPSYHEGLPLGLLEASATGRIVIASDIPGCRVVVKNGQNGLLVQPRSAPALVEALRNVLKDPKTFSGLGLAARQNVEREFALPLVNKAYLNLYDSLMIDESVTHDLTTNERV